jgi:hypothetical protein
MKLLRKLTFIFALAIASAPLLVLGQDDDGPGISYTQETYTAGNVTLLVTTCDNGKTYYDLIISWER